MEVLLNVPISDPFELVDERYVHERKTNAKMYRHVKSGATLLTLDNDDINKAFCITFKTPTTGSTGLPHIMEHSVLCGSKKYPVKEPFIELVKGSLNTFLNAFTGSSETYYPVASQNRTDLYNLVDVYLDAVFHPNLTPNTLAQEGWHYGIDRPDDPITYKGVVFNEMKGAYGSADRLLADAGRRALFPDTAYRNDAGGDPKAIPDLTWEQFSSFHETYYHPSNAFIIWYGDDHSTDRFAKLDSYLSEFDARDTIEPIPLQQRIRQSQTISTTYATSGLGTEKCYLGISWLLDDDPSSHDQLKFQILRHILLGTPASPLRKAVAESGLADDVHGSFDANRQSFMQVAIKGVSRDNLSEVERLVNDTLVTLAECGIDSATVESSLNSVEFALRENNSGSFPRGLALGLAATEGWLYRNDPFSHLYFETNMLSIRESATPGRLFEDMIRNYLVNNNHRVTVQLLPDAELNDREALLELEKLSALKSKMSVQEIDELVKITSALRLAQETPDPPENLALLPTLTISDLDRHNKVISTEFLQFENVTVQVHELDTSGIVYCDLALDLHVLPERLLPLTPLFARALSELGTTKRDYVTLIQDIGRETGGISKHVLFQGIHGSDQCAARLVVRGKSVANRSDYLLSTMAEMLMHVKLDQADRFRQIILEEKTRLESALSPAGSRFVDSRMRRGFGESSWAAEATGGTSYLAFVKSLSERCREDWPSVLGDLSTLQTSIVERGSVFCNVTVDSETRDQALFSLVEALGTLPDRASAPKTWQRERHAGRELLAMPSQVNYIGMAASLYEIGYEWNGTIGVINNYLQTGYLWEKIRVQGGAYGAGCRFDPFTGVFGFTSYRDPNVKNTLASFRSSVEYLTGLDITQSEIDSAIIGVIGDMDAYQLPDAQGFTSFLRWLSGDTDHARQKRREQVLATSLVDFHELAGHLRTALNNAVECVLGPMNAQEQFNEIGPTCDVIQVS